MRVTAPAAATVAAVVLAAGLTGCASESKAADGGPVEIRFSWWGSDTRHQATQKVIDLFEKKNPDIHVVPDYTDWEGYWDKLATQVAAGDAPDVMTQEERYLADYAERGALADLKELGVDTSKIAPEVVAQGETAGGLFGIPTGVNAYSVLADPQAFADAGVELPDDTTWTWDDYVEIANKISAASGGKVWGMQDYGFNEAGISILARQRGEALYDGEGEVAVSEQTVADYFQRSLDLQAGGGEPPADKTVEVQEAGPEGSLLGTNTGAMGVWWSNQLGAVSSASGRDLELLRWPGEEPGVHGMYFKPAMYYGISSRSKHPQAAAKLVDFLLNDVEAAKIILTDRGLPANTEVREQIVPDLPETEAKVAAFMDELGSEIDSNPPVPPKGSGEVEAILKRLNAEVLFDRMTPQEAATQFLDEVDAATGQ